MMNLSLDSVICHDVAKPFPLPDECIDVVITSPPYWGLRDYGKEVRSIFGGDPNCKHIWVEEKTGLMHENRNFLEGTQEDVVGQKQTTWIRKYDEISSGFCKMCGAWQGQLGLEPHPQMYIEHLVQVCREIKRVLKKTGSFYLNIGDTFFGGKGKSGSEEPDEFIERKKQGVVQGNASTYKGDRPSDICKQDKGWLQPKQLLGIPERVMTMLQGEGWILRNKIIWHKPNPMPSSVKDRLNTTWEYVFHFVKSRRYYYDLDAIREPHKTSIENLEKRINADRSGTTSTKKDLDSLVGGPQFSTEGPRYEYHGKFKDVDPHFQSVSERKNYQRQILGVPHDLATCNLKGKNPGDVFRNKPVKNIGGMRQSPEPNDPDAFHPCGKNPGDVIEYDSKYKDGKHGQSLQGFIRCQSIAKERVKSREEAKKLFPGDTKKQQEHINFIHDHGGDPRGKNPGDIVKSKFGEGKGYNNPLINMRHGLDGSTLGDTHPHGCNPGDVFQSKKETYVGNNPHRMRLRRQEYLVLDYRRPDDLSHPKGKNPGDVITAKYKGQDVNPSEGHIRRGKELHDAFPPGYNGHPLGKNPGDVIKQGMHHGSSLTKGRATHYEGQLIDNHPKGKNPGDVICPSSWGVDKNQEYHGDGKHNPKGQSPSDLKRTIIESYKNDPKGKNPGDVVKLGKLASSEYQVKGHGLLSPRKRAQLQELSDEEFYHPKGKNPGDVIKQPYAAQPRDKPFVECRNLPDLKEFSTWINNWRKQQGITIDKIESDMDSQAPHHWFNGEAYPSVDDWKRFKELYDPPAFYDDQLLKVFLKPSEKVNNPKGRNPCDVIEYDLPKECGLPTTGPKARSNLPSQEQHREGNLINPHPDGRNPGDVVKHDSAIGRTGNVSYTDPLHTKPYHEGGKNPGDIIGGKFYVGDGYRQGMNRDENAFSIQLKDPPDPRKIVDYLRKHKGDRTYKEIDQSLGYEGDCSSHWFTYPESEHGFSYPSPDDWMKLKKLLGFDDTFDRQMTETIMVPQTVAVHPYGRNPGDVIRDRDRKVEWIKGKGGNESGIRSLSGSTYPYTKDKNPGDFFEICTQPFTGYNPELEHFAVFPGELLLKPLKSSCPRWVCKKCGHPRNRISKRNVSVEDAGLPQSERKEPYQQSKGISVKGGENYTKWLIENPIETVGWTDCGCGEGFEPGVVLDPFCGRGTVGKVAKSLGLHYILFDIKPEYCELSRLFIGGQKYKVHKTQMKLEGFA